MRIAFCSMIQQRIVTNNYYNVLFVNAIFIMFPLLQTLLSSSNLQSVARPVHVALPDGALAEAARHLVEFPAYFCGHRAFAAVLVGFAVANTKHTA